MPGRSGGPFPSTATRPTAWLSFIRWGHADGGAGVAAEDAFSVGAEYKVRKDQFWAIAVGWAKPVPGETGVERRDELVIETSYRAQVSPSISLMPDLQLLFDPANNPSADTAWIAGIRAIVNL